MIRTTAVTVSAFNLKDPIYNHEFSSGSLHEAFVGIRRQEAAIEKRLPVCPELLPCTDYRPPFTPSTVYSSIENYDTTEIEAGPEGGPF